MNLDQKALYKLTYGLFLLTAKDDDIQNGCIVNTAFQITSSPVKLCVTVNKNNFTHDLIHKSGVFTLSALSQDASFDLFKRFGFQSGHNVNKFDGFNSYKTLDNSTVYITEGTNAYFSANVLCEVDCVTHTMFIGEVTQMQVLSDVPSATYEYYQNNIKPKPQAVGVTPNGQIIWRCKICGYEYIGDPIPEDFICPVCKHPASDFERIIPS